MNMCFLGVKKQTSDRQTEEVWIEKKNRMNEEIIHEMKCEDITGGRSYLRINWAESKIGIIPCYLKKNTLK